MGLLRLKENKGYCYGQRIFASDRVTHGRLRFFYAVLVQKGKCI